MKNSITTLLGSALLATGIASALITAPANAFTLGSCSTSNVSGSVSCGVGNTNQDSVSPNKPLTVNTEAFFDYTDWAFGGKIGDTGYEGSGSGQSGTWNISSVFQKTWDDVMLVFKSGPGTTLTSYMLADNLTSGTWSSPFESVKNGKVSYKDVSHISVYYRASEAPSPAPVPEPATLMGLGLVASGMVMARRRKSSQSA